MFARLTIGKRIWLAVAVLLGLLSVLGAVSLFSMFRSEAALNAIIADPLPGIYEIGRMADCVGHLRALTLMHVVSTDAAERANFQNEIGQRERAFAEFMARYERTITTSQDRELFARIGPAFSAYDESIRRVLRLSEDSKAQERADVHRRIAAAGTEPHSGRQRGSRSEQSERGQVRRHGQGSGACRATLDLGAAADLDLSGRRRGGLPGAGRERAASRGHGELAKGPSRWPARRPRCSSSRR